MEKNYRIIKEAVPFILEKHATAIYSLETWNSIGIDIKALEEVKPAFVSYGIKSGERSTDLSGWDKENGAKCCFTITFPSMQHQEYDKFSKGRMIRELMNKIQNNIDYFYQQYHGDYLNI